MPRYVDLDNPKIIRGERDRFGLVVYHIPPDTSCLNLTERQKGRWIEYIPEHGKCPFCGNQVDLLNGKANNFCGECGAYMRTKETDCDYERAVEQLEHDMLYEPTFNQNDGSM